MYLREMEAKEETVLERQAKMRERAKFVFKYCYSDSRNL
jgi:hypothetical protein